MGTERQWEGRDREMKTEKRRERDREMKTEKGRKRERGRWVQRDSGRGEMGREEKKYGDESRETGDGRDRG